MKAGEVKNISRDKNNKKTVYQKQVYDELLKKFNSLELLLKQEREAILLLQEGNLEKCGIAIDNILGDLSEKMLSAKSLDPDQAGELARVIAHVREERQNNRMLLESVIQETGRAIGRASSGRRVLRAYGNPRSGEELFVKKEC